MVKLQDICDIEKLEEHVENRRIRVYEDHHGVRIYNYTSNATYNNSWDETTRTCRGLIVDQNDFVLARPFPKFFGITERYAPAVPQDEPMHVTVKLDGSLGIAYHHPQRGICVSTRGHLDSPQSEEATRIWHEKYGDMDFPQSLTPLLEIVYPANRVVVDYGELRDLFLLCVVDIATGADLPLSSIRWTGPVAESEHYDSFDSLMSHVLQQTDMNANNEEGYVVRFGDGYDRYEPHTRIKLKFPAYVDKHRVAFGLTTLRVWEALAVASAASHEMNEKRMVATIKLSPERIRGLLVHGVDPIDVLRSNVPEEMLPWFDTTVDTFTEQHRRLIRKHRRLYVQAEQHTADDTDKAFASSVRELAETEDVQTDILYRMRRNKDDVELMVWKQIRPEANIYAKPQGTLT